MRALMITKSAWNFLRRLCSENPHYIFDAKKLTRDMETVGGTKVAGSYMAALRNLGIIDTYGRLTELGKRWADDKTYPDTCRELAEAHFSQAMRDALLMGSSVNSLADEYAEQEGMGRAGALKNLYVLNMLLADGGYHFGETSNSAAVERGGSGKHTVVDASTPTSDTPSKRPDPSPLELRVTPLSEERASISLSVPTDKTWDIIHAIMSTMNLSGSQFEIKIS